MTRSHENINRLDRYARRIGLVLIRLGTNKRGFTYSPTQRWMEYKLGGKGILEVTAYQHRDGPVEAVVHKRQSHRWKRCSRALPRRTPSHVGICCILRA